MKWTHSENERAESADSKQKARQRINFVPSNTFQVLFYRLYILKGKFLLFAYEVHYINWVSGL